MPSAQETFGTTVVEPIRVNVDGGILSYAEYIALPETQRSNDEAAVVDLQFAAKMLQWLGYSEGDIVYNRTTPARPQDKPDFVVKVLGSTAFVIEDKSTDEQFDDGSVKQLRRYTAGSAGYCVWSNGRTILGLRFDPNGNYRLLVEVRVDGTFGQQRSLFPQEANFEIFRLLFNKDRFANAASLITSVAITEADWREQAKPLTDHSSLQVFIDESRFVLDQLATAATSRLVTAALDMEEASNDYRRNRETYTQVVNELVLALRSGVDEGELSRLETGLLELRQSLDEVEASQIEALRPSMGPATATRWVACSGKLRALVSRLRERELARSESRRIRAAYLVWRERYTITEEDEQGSQAAVELRRQRAFAEQVSYVFFVRLLLVRVLEDKGIMQRLISDGGFGAWYEFLRRYATDATDDIQGESFLPLVYRRVARYYRHFFQQPVFDWFQPDDYLVTLALHRLNQYDFGHVTSDLLGFTYEAFIDRVARNRKGHFLTPPELVGFILDRAGYSGRSIIGESLLDPACGSGSFLVHATRRLREALAVAFQEQGRDEVELAKEFISQVTTKLVGLEINPFSCYLAELNLFIQVLDDMVRLWNAGEPPDLERFSIYNTNSLEMPQAVLYGTTSSFTDDLASLDEASAVKDRRGGFGFVVFNPPYVNRGIVLGERSYREFPFFQQVLKGDENAYLLFLRIAAYYVAEGGTTCFICPLNLFGDESSQKAREFFGKVDELSGALEWKMATLTRFYSRTVQFPGVLQGVCVARFDKAQATPDDMVEIRGGHSVVEASNFSIQIRRSRIVSNFSPKDIWNRAWLVNANLDAYDIWEFVRAKSNRDLSELIYQKMRVREGDARSTWAKPMLVSAPSRGVVPLTKGSHIVDWDGWSAASLLNPAVTIPTSAPNYKSSLWVQRQVQRVVNLTESETAIFLKEVSGLEMKRPIRGAITQRDGEHPVVADHTVLVLYTLDAAYEELAYAVFGLVTSSTYNFLFSLFSTNPHANYKEILRVPIPVWSPTLQQLLASATKEALLAHERLHLHEQAYGVDHDGSGVSVAQVLSTTKLPTLRLEELVLRGDIAVTGNSNRKIEVLLDAGQLVVSPNLSPDAAQAIHLALKSYGMLNYNKGGRDVLLPAPRVSHNFLGQLSTIQLERNAITEQVEDAHRRLDDMVVSAYEITASWREIVEAGMPWAGRD